MSTGRIFDFQISDVLRALALHAGFGQRVAHGMKWVRDVIVLDLLLKS